MSYYASTETTCDYCGEVIPEGGGIYEGVNGEYCSDECRREAEPERVCDRCGDWEASTEYNEDLDAAICDYCWDNDTFECPQCGHRWWYHSSVYSERNDEHYCCYECRNDAEDGHSDTVHNYGYKPSPEFFKVDGEEGAYFFGIENEMNSDCACTSTEYTIDKKYGDRVYQKEDGSLDYGGVEFVSHPMTLRAHAHKMNWNNLINIANNGGLWADTDCGLHIHVGIKEMKDEVRCKANLVRFFNWFWDYMVEESDREFEGKIDEWAGIPAMPYDDEHEEAFYEDSDINLIDYCRGSGRYQAVNLHNLNTVEIRIFAGQNSGDKILEKIALVNRIVEVCDNMDWKQIKNLNFFTDVLDVAMATLVNIIKETAEVA